MKCFLFTVLPCFIVLTVTAPLLPAQEDGHKPHTVRTNEKRYITTGKMTVPVPLEQSRQVIQDTDQWNNWMFSGMDGSTETPDRFLLVYITGVEFSDENHMIATVEFRFLRSLGRDPSYLPFLVSRHYGEEGALERVSAVLSQKNTMIESAQYEIVLSGNDTQTVITYTAIVRLRSFFEFFITLKSYKKTIAWYLQKLMINFTHEAVP